MKNSRADEKLEDLFYFEERKDNIEEQERNEKFKDQGPIFFSVFYCFYPIFREKMCFSLIKWAEIGKKNKMLQTLFPIVFSNYLPQEMARKPGYLVQN